MKHKVYLATRKPHKGSNFFNNNGLNKVCMIKAVRNATNMGLKEAKELVETLPTNESFTIDTSHARLPLNEALLGVRACGLVVDCSDDPIALLWKAVDLATEAHNAELAHDILGAIRNHV